jgi:two-component system, sporulation sensor kinase A
MKSKQLLAINNNVKSHISISQQFIMVLTIGGQFQYISPSCQELLGYSPSEMIGKKLDEFIHKDDIFLLESYFFQEQPKTSCTFRMKTHDQQYIWVEAEVETVHSSKEVLIKTRVTAGIHEKEKETHLPILQPLKNDDQSIEHLLQDDASELIEKSPIAIVITKYGKIRYANEAAAQLLRADNRKELIGRYTLDFITEEYQEIAKKRIASIQKGNSVGVIEQRWKRMDGSLIDVEIQSKPILFQGELSEYIVIYDISSRKNFQFILQKSREKYRKLIQNSIDTIAVICNDKIVFINESGVKLFGANSYTDLLGKNIYSLLHPNDHEQMRSLFSLATKEIKKLELCKPAWLTLDNRKIYTEIVCIPTTFFSEPAVQMIIRDVTDRKRAEELMLYSEKLSIAGQLAAGIAHEIRNPLTAIKGFLQLVEIHVKDKKQYFDIIYSELKRIELILSELLVLAKPQEVVFRPALTASLLRDVVTLLETQAILHGVEIHLDLKDEDTLIYCDENQMKQVFINFIKNSIDAMPNGGHLYIHQEREDDYLKICFIDNGCGIPEEILKKIWEPFYTTKEKGTGLGLMVSYKIIENHLGLVSVKSKVNEGTTFEIKLPIREVRKQDSD